MNVSTNMTEHLTPWTAIRTMRLCKSTEQRGTRSCRSSDGAWFNSPNRVVDPSAILLFQRLGEVMAAIWEE